MRFFRAFLLIIRVLFIIETSTTSHFEENLYNFQMKLAKLCLDAQKQSYQLFEVNIFMKKIQIYLFIIVMAFD